jgi:hypothetical protein
MFQNLFQNPDGRSDDGWFRHGRIWWVSIMVLLIEISHGVGLRSQMVGGRTTSSVALCGGVTSALQPVSFN